ncbi:MAG TPA: phosphoribosyltransferase family protein [Methanosarcina sp.]|nr:phosphoribosyltransferase family protein [Methanosarcina sp.]
MSNKVYYTNDHVTSWVQTILRGITNDVLKDDWKPDYIVGLTRGGLIPAVMISHYLGIPMHTLKVSLRDDIEGPESNLWMAEDALGGKNILIVDDINDSGETLKWIKQDWPKSAYPNDARWQTVWNNSIRFAALVNNQSSSFKDVDYFGMEINKFENPNQWIVFPWEDWWT